MSKSPRVVFKMQRVAEGDWQIEAHYPGVEIRLIKGFKSKVEVDEWLNGSRRIEPASQPSSPAQNQTSVRPWRR